MPYSFDKTLVLFLHVKDGQVLKVALFPKFWQIPAIKRVKLHLFYQHALKAQCQQDDSIIKPSRINDLNLQSTEEIPGLNAQRTHQSTNHSQAYQHLHRKDKWMFDICELETHWMYEEIQPSFF